MIQTTFVIWSFDQDSKTMRLESSRGICLDNFRNFTLHNFNYTSFVYSIELFYECSLRTKDSPIISNYTCGSTTYFYAGRSFRNLLIMNAECSGNFTVPVPDLIVRYLDDGTRSLQDTVANGFEVSYYTYYPDCNNCEIGGGVCGLSSLEPYGFACYCSNGSVTLNSTCPIPIEHHPGGRKAMRYIVFIGVAVVGAVILLTSVWIFYYSRRGSPHKLFIFWKKGSNEDNDIEEFIRNCGSLAPKRYNFGQIKKMTNSFEEKLGEGGFGSVFKGKLKDGSLVAVKILNKSKGKGEEFINEVASISRTSHVNIVAFVGFCFEGQKRALIYEFVPNGSLEKFIYDDNLQKSGRQLGWEKLYKIAIGIAKGLDYLHDGCSARIFHFDIKPHNILLNEDFHPKIADFGLAKLCPQKQSIVSMADARGTIGYVAPEVFNRNYGVVSHKSDVYSYGMMVLEMVGGRKNIEIQDGHTSEIYFPEWIYKRLEVDNDLGLWGVVNEEENELARKMVLIGLWCIQTDPSHRPSISHVIEMFEGNIESLKIPPKPFLSSTI